MIALDGQSLTPSMVQAVADGAKVSLAPGVRARMGANVADVPPDIIRAKWEWLVGGPAPRSSADAIRTFIEGHCAGVGPPMASSDVRAMMACRANVLAGGHTGARPEAAELLVAMLNHDRIPVVPRHGAVGVGGSIPLSHVVAVMCAYSGTASTPDGVVPAAQAMSGLPVLKPTEKDALSLMNGSTLSTALAALAVHKARVLIDSAVSATALSFEVVQADTSCLALAPLVARNHPGAVTIAGRVKALVSGSSLATRHRRPDPFSIRCAPQSLGAALDTLDHVEQVVARELNAAIDNPLVIDGVVHEGGNFHGSPIALVMDHLKAAMTQVGSMSERRLFRMTYGQLSGLPSFLVEGTGKNSGLMLAQYTAASLVSECKGLCHPASVDSIPTIQHHEDHVSMGPIAARGALHVVELLQDVVAIELMCGAQGLDFHLDAGAEPGTGTARVHARVRERVTRWTEDRVLHTDLNALGRAVRAGAFATPLQEA